MKLYLMRHGQAASPDIDPQQGLSEAGRQGIEQLAQRLAAQGIRVDQVLHSEKTRARQTAEIMAAALAPDVSPQQRRGLKPNDAPSDFIPELECLQEDTLIASHLPFVPSLLAELTGSFNREQGMSFVPGTIICLTRQDAGWQLEWIDSP